MNGATRFSAVAAADGAKGKRPDYRRQFGKEHFGLAHVTCLNQELKSEAQSRFVGGCGENGEAQAQALSKEIDYLKQTHFSLGNCREKIATTKQLYQVTHPERIETATLNAEKMRDLRRVHFALGDCNEKWVSQYRYAHGATAKA